MYEEDRCLDCDNCGARLEWTGEQWGRLDDGFLWYCRSCDETRMVAFVGA